jgi:hypothetical protein
VSGEPLHDWVVVNVLYNHNMARNEVLRNALSRIEGTMAAHEKQQQEEKHNDQTKNIRIQDQQVNTNDTSKVVQDKIEAYEYTAKDYDEFSQVRKSFAPSNQLCVICFSFCSL